MVPGARCRAVRVAGCAHRLRRAAQVRWQVTAPIGRAGLRRNTYRHDVRGVEVVKSPVTPDAPSNVCPKCKGTLIEDLDGDRECLQCGYVAYARVPKDVPREGRRRPKHGKIKL